MNHFLRLQTFIRSRFYGAMFLELLMGVRDFQLQMWLPQVFAERVLNDEDLVEIEAWLLAQESVLISSTRIAEAGETSFLADFETISRTLGDYEHPERYPASPARKTILSPFYCVLEQELIAIFRRYRETLETLASPDWRPSVHSQKFLSRQNERAKSAEDRRMYLALFSPNLSVCEEALNIGFSSLRLLRIACRVERFRLREGRLPATLDELGDLGRDLPPDPFSGKPFRYRVGAIRFSSVYEHSEHRNSEKTGRGYLLYGVGKDLSDDGGRFLPDGKTKDDILMVLDPGSVRDAEPSP